MKNIIKLSSVKFASIELKVAILCELIDWCIKCVSRALILLGTLIRKSVKNKSMHFKGIFVIGFYHLLDVQIHVVEFPPFFQGDNFCDFIFCFSPHLPHSKQGSTLKGKNLLPVGANSFLFE